MGSATSWLCRIWGGWDGPPKTTSSTVKPRFGIWARAVETADVVCGKCSRGRMQKADAQFVVLCDDSPRKRTQQRKTAKVHHHHQQMYMGMLRLLSGAETWEGFTYSSIGTWINKLWYHKKTEAVKRKTLQQHATTWMNLGGKYSESRKKKTTTSITKSHSRGRKGDETEPPQCLGVLSSSIEVISEFPPPGKRGDGEMPCHTYARILLRVSGDADVTSLEQSLCLYR
ncbi:uncharacterized protein LOC118880003 [Balaenoptera musculus]|uniref:Uncharacterized protein LOC118880003 n=1 Tax=Balaenoptera musculus TaxID=9771 RepID=A0A8B8V351_BALMU|nr:uncharacterized protein LOC118880003 [Balaenoptera musculus]